MLELTRLMRMAQTAQDPVSQPLYRQLQRALRDAVEQKLFGPDEALPAERHLAEQLAVSRITVRKAIDGLVQEGLLVRRPGAGNFVNARIEKDVAQLTSFSEEMAARGRAPKNVWLARAEGAVTADEALRLDLPPGAPVYRFTRIRLSNNMPMCLEYATVDAAALPALDAVDLSIYKALERTGHRPVRARQRLSALLLSADEAALLQTMPGEPGLSIERLGLLADGRAVEFCRSIFRGDRYDFIADAGARPGRT